MTHEELVAEVADIKKAQSMTIDYSIGTGKALETMLFGLMASVMRNNEHATKVFKIFLDGGPSGDLDPEARNAYDRMIQGARDFLSALSRQ